MYHDENIEDLFGDDGRIDSERSDEEDGDLSSKKDGYEENHEASGEDEKGEEKKKKKVVVKRAPKSSHPRLDPDRLCGPRGIRAIEDEFKGVKLKGKGYEKSDLDIVMKKMEHWAHRLFPQLSFDDCLERIEKLGVKKGVQVHMKKLRMGMLDTETEVTNGDSNFDPPVDNEIPAKDVFDDLLAHYSKPAASSPSLTSEQLERMAENRRRAQEKRKSQMSQSLNSSISSADQSSHTLPKVTETDGDQEQLMDIDSMLEDLPQDYRL